MDEFVKLLEGLADEIGDTRALELIDKATEIKEGYDDDIETLKYEVKELKSDLELAEADRDQFKAEAIELEEKIKEALTIPSAHDNIITRGVIEKLVDNIDRINITDLETFINKYL